jgi:hypothetical protein
MATKLMLPRAVSHPADELGTSLSKKERKVRRKASDAAPSDIAKGARKQGKKLGKKLVR